MNFFSIILILFLFSKTESAILERNKRCKNVHKQPSESLPELKFFTFLNGKYLKFTLSLDSIEISQKKLILY